MHGASWLVFILIIAMSSMRRYVFNNIFHAHAKTQRAYSLQQNAIRHDMVVKIRCRLQCIPPKRNHWHTNKDIFASFALVGK